LHELPLVINRNLTSTGPPGKWPTDLCMCVDYWSIDWVKVLRLTRHKIDHFRDVPKPISWLGMEKQILTQQKHMFNNQNKCTTTQNRHRKTKARLSHLLRYLAQKRRGPILISALH